ncbi:MULTISPECIES: SAV_6107 family HEPN domain-containing protein [Actinoalloteichus]|nr:MULTISPECIES: SAV_6107 family HEPN domain-containing protein [Actinoalloteichus]
MRPAPAPSSSALALLDQARFALGESCRAVSHHDRFLHSYLSALRAGAAVLATRTRPAPGLSRPRSVWWLLSQAAPEFAEWAGFFESCSARRAAVQAGVLRVVSVRDADDLERQVHQFLALAESAVWGGRR